MFKKILIAGLGIGLAGGLIFGRDAASYVRTTANQVTESVKESVPITFEVERAKKMIASLDPEIRRNMHLIAKEEVEVDRLRRQVERLDSKLEGDRDDLVRLKTDLERGQDYYTYAGRRYSQNQVKIDLANRFNRVKTNDATLVNLSKMLNAREQGLAAGRHKLEEMLAAKQQLIVDVENLMARQKMVEVAQTTSEFNFDDSRLSRTKDLVRDIQTRIEVAERLVSVEGNFHSEIPLEEPPASDDLLDQVAKYLGTTVVQPEISTVAEIDLD